MTNNSGPLREDLLTGARAIAEYLGWPVRKVFYAQKHLPISSVGRTLIARKSELNTALSASASKAEQGVTSHNR
jgi:hypothetical protein